MLVWEMWTFPCGEDEIGKSGELGRARSWARAGEVNSLLCCLVLKRKIMRCVRSLFYAMTSASVKRMRSAVCYEYKFSHSTTSEWMKIINTKFRMPNILGT